MFNKARIKLTLWYLLIISVISLFFSIFIYKVITSELDRFAFAQQVRIERRMINNTYFVQNHLTITPPPTEPSLLDPDLVKDAKDRLVLILAAINGGIILVSGGLGYLLAGKTLEPIQKMIEEQNRFISDSSHEFRTPLTSLKSSMEVSLRDKNLTIEEARQLIKENINDVNKLESLSDELLLLAQFQKRNNHITFETNSLQELIKNSISEVASISKKKNITIKNNVQDIKIEGNKESLNKLFVIILDNAIKYSPEKTVITIDRKKSDGQVYIYFRDQGIGIGEKDLPHIFDRFYRADMARSKAGSGGYGLGLSIAKRIVELHHGKISVSSKPGKGSTFIIKLPS